MKTLLEKNRIGVSLLVLGIIVSVVGLAGYATAKQSFRQEVVLETAKQATESLLNEGDDLLLGSIDQRESSLFTGYTHVNITGQLRFGEGDGLFTNNGFSLGYKFIDVNATSTGSELNNTGETLYVYDGYIRQQTASSTLSGGAYLIGTSTTEVLPGASLCGATGVCGSTTAAEASILNTNSIETQIVGDTYFKVDFAGTDTGYLGTTVVPVRDGEYIICSASSTPASNVTFDGQAVQCVVKFYTLDD